MSTSTLSLKALPEQARDHLSQFGHNIEVAIKRRRMTRQEVADRALISVPTLRAVLRGDPSVGIGCYISVLQVLGLDNGIIMVASPSYDEVGLALEERNLPKTIRKSRNKYEF